MAKTLDGFTINDLPADILNRHPNASWINAFQMSMKFEVYIRSNFDFMKNKVNTTDGADLSLEIQNLLTGVPDAWKLDILEIFKLMYRVRHGADRQMYDVIIKMEEKPAPSRNNSKPSSTYSTSRPFLPSTPVFAPTTVYKPDSLVQQTEPKPVEYAPFYRGYAPAPSRVIPPKTDSSYQNQELVNDLLDQIQQLKKELQTKQHSGSSSLALENQMQGLLSSLAGLTVYEAAAKDLFKVESEVLNGIQLGTSRVYRDLLKKNLLKLAQILQNLTLIDVVKNYAVRSTVQYIGSSVLAGNLLLRANPGQSRPASLPVIRAISDASSEMLPDLFARSSNIPYVLMALSIHVSESAKRVHEHLAGIVGEYVDNAVEELFSFAERSYSDILTDPKGSKIRIYSFKSESLEEVGTDIDLKAHLEHLLTLGNIVVNQSKHKVPKLPDTVSFLINKYDRGLFEMTSLLFSPLLRTMLNSDLATMHRFESGLLPVLSLTAVGQVKNIIEKCPHLKGEDKVILRACVAAYVCSNVQMLLHQIGPDHSEEPKIKAMLESLRSSLEDRPSKTYALKMLAFAATALISYPQMKHTTMAAFTAIADQLIDPSAVLQIFLEIGSTLNFDSFDPASNLINDRARVFFFDSLMQALGDYFDVFTASLGLLSDSVNDRVLKKEIQELFTRRMGKLAAVTKSKVRVSYSMRRQSIPETARVLSLGPSNLAFIFESSDPQPSTILAAVREYRLERFLGNNRVLKRILEFGDAKTVGRDLTYEELVSKVSGSKIYDEKFQTVAEAFVGYLKWLKIGNKPTYASQAVQRFQFEQKASVGMNVGATYFRNAVVGALGFDARDVLRRERQGQPASVSNRNMAFNMLINGFISPDETADYPIFVTNPTPLDIIGNINALSTAVGQLYTSRKLSVRLGLEMALGKLWHANILFYSPSTAGNWDEITWCCCILLNSTRVNNSKTMAGFKALIKAMSSVAKLKPILAKLQGIDTDMDARKMLQGVDTSNTGSKTFRAICTEDFHPFYLEPANIVMRTIERSLLQYHEDRLGLINSFATTGAAIIRSELAIASDLLFENICDYKREQIADGSSSFAVDIANAKIDLNKSSFAEILFFAKDTSRQPGILFLLAQNEPDPMLAKFTGERARTVASKIRGLLIAIIAAGMVKIEEVKVEGETYKIPKSGSNLDLDLLLQKIVVQGYESSTTKITQEISMLLKNPKLPEMIRAIPKGHFVLELSKDNVGIKLDLSGKPMDRTSSNWNFRKETYTLSRQGGVLTKYARMVEQIAADIMIHLELESIVGGDGHFKREGIEYEVTSPEYEEQRYLYVIESLEFSADQIRQYTTDDAVRGISASFIGRDNRKKMTIALEKVDFMGLLDFAEIHNTVIDLFQDKSPKGIWEHLPHHIQERYDLEPSLAAKIHPPVTIIQPTAAQKESEVASPTQCKAPLEQTRLGDRELVLEVSQSLKTAMTATLEASSSPSMDSADVNKSYSAPMPVKKFGGFKPVSIRHSSSSSQITARESGYVSPMLNVKKGEHQ